MVVIIEVNDILLSGTIPTEDESEKIVQKVLDELLETEQTE